MNKSVIGTNLSSTGREGAFLKLEEGTASSEHIDDDKYKSAKTREVVVVVVANGGEDENEEAERKSRNWTEKTARERTSKGIRQI